MTTFAESGQSDWMLELRDGPSPEPQTLTDEHFVVDRLATGPD